MYIRTKTASSAPNFTALQYITKYRIARILHQYVSYVRVYLYRALFCIPGTYVPRTRYLVKYTYMVPGILPVFIYRIFQGCVLQGTYRTYPGYLPRVLPYKKLLYVCRTFIPVPETFVSSVRPCHNTRNFCEFCMIPIPLPGTCVTSIGLAQYPGYGYTFLTIPGEPGIHSGLTRRVHHAL